MPEAASLKHLLVVSDVIGVCFLAGWPARGGGPSAHIHHRVPVTVQGGSAALGLRPAVSPFAQLLALPQHPGAAILPSEPTGHLLDGGLEPGTDADVFAVHQFVYL